MAKRKCKDYMDLITLHDNYQRQEEKATNLDIAKPLAPRLERILRFFIEKRKGKTKAISESELRVATKKLYGKIDERKLIADKFVALLNKHPDLAEMMEDFITLEATLLKDPKLKFGPSKEDPKKMVLDLNTLPIGILRNAFHELQGVIQHGKGENIGKRWLRGLLGPLDVQVPLPKTVAKKEYTGAIYNMVKAIKAFPRNQANFIARFSKKDPTRTDFVEDKKGNIVNRDYGMNDILKAIENLSQDSSLLQLKSPVNKKVLHSMFTWHNVRDDMYNRRLIINDDGSMLIANSYREARDEKGRLIMWPKKTGGLKTRGVKYVFAEYIPVEEYYKDMHVPMNNKMVNDFKEQSRKFDQLHKNVWEFVKAEFERVNNALFDELKTLVPPEWTLQDLNVLFFGEDPTKFKRYDKRTGKTAQWSDLTDEQKEMIELLHTHATRYSVLKPFIFNGRDEEVDLGEGRISFPITYNQFKFSIMWDEMIFEYEKKLGSLLEELDTDIMQKPKTNEQKELKYNLNQEKKNVVSILTRAKRIRDRKDDYPVDMGSGTYLALGEDSKHVKHISNAFNILEARSDKGAYFRYLQHHFSGLERNRLTTILIKNMKRADSAAVKKYMLNLYKTGTYQPDAASGFSWFKWDSDTVSRLISFKVPLTNKKVEVTVSAAKIDRKMRKILSVITGNLLRGQGTAITNYTAIVEKMFDVGNDRVIEALDLIKVGGKEVERLIELSGVVDFREFFSASLTSDANNLGAENKEIIKLHKDMIKYWGKVHKLGKKLKIDAPNVTTETKIEFEKGKRKFKEELEQKFGRKLKVIVERERLKKRLPVLKDLHQANLLRKWVDYAINKEYEAADYIESKGLKHFLRWVEKWIVQTEREHLPTMGKTETALRSISLIIGIRSAMKAGFITEMPLGDLLNNPKLLEQALAIGVAYTELMDFGLSRQDLGQIGAGNIGAFFTQFKVWSMQKFAKDLARIKGAYQELGDVDKDKWHNKYVDLGAVGSMLESLIRYNKYSNKKLRSTHPRLASYRSWFLTQGLWTMLWNTVLMGPITVVPGFKFLAARNPFLRSIGGATSDLISWMMLLPSIWIALSFGEGEDEIEKLIDFYFRKTVFGVGGGLLKDLALAIVALVDADDDEERNDKIDKVLQPFYPPVIKETRIVRHLLPED